jgi:flagellar biogenesis protein FliO
MVTPVAYQESDTSRNAQPSGRDSASSAKPPAANAEKTPLAPQNHKSKTPLPPNGSTGSTGKFAGGLPSTISIAGSTGLVLGIFLLLVWIVRRKTPQSLVRLPAEAFEVLGRAPMGSRQQVQLLRCGMRLLLVSVTPAGAETLTEITDPAEVDRLCGLCRQTQPGSSSVAFKQIFEQLAPRRPGRTESSRHEDEPETARAGYRRGGRLWEDRDV